MIIDSELYIDEFIVIKVWKEILEVEDKKYNELINEAKELNGCGYDAVINWIQPALYTLQTINDPEMNRFAISNMLLVAKADGNLTDIEIDFIEYCAMFLDISVPKLRQVSIMCPNATQLTILSIQIGCQQ